MHTPQLISFSWTKSPTCLLHPSSSHIYCSWCLIACKTLAFIIQLWHYTRYNVYRTGEYDAYICHITQWTVTHRQSQKNSRFMLQPARTYVRVVLHVPREQLVRFIHHWSSCDRTHDYIQKRRRPYLVRTPFGGGGAGVLIYRKHKIAERPRGVNTKYLIQRSGTVAELRRWTNAASRSERKASRPSEEPSQHQKYLYISPRRPR